MSESIAVIGGGIAGVQAALDLATAGVEVHLIERGPSLGGHMAQLDKTFPTNDCSVCILSPKLVEACRHELIRVWTMTDVIGLEGEAPELNLRLRVRPRYVDEEKCVGCGECSHTCPVSVDSEFDMGLGTRRAIFVPFPQAVPLKYAIEHDHCLMFNKGRCGVCQKICPADAIDFTMEEREEILEVGAVIIATGFDQLDPREIAPYRYGESPDLVTGLEFERLLSPSGPTGGRLIKNDGSAPRRLVFVQCAGSRDVNHCEYCSRFCCMASLKQAMVAIEHEPLLEEITVCYMDMRSYGKDYDRYLERAAGLGIRLLKGRVSEVITDPLGVRVEDVRSASIEEIEADMIVLAMAAVPSKGTMELAKSIGIECAGDGFIRTMASAEGALLTSRRGVFAAGCCAGPKDIPDSVCEASASASLALNILAKRKPRPLGKPKMREISGEAPRVGVFVCMCGTNIASTVDVPMVVASAFGIEGVVHAEESMFTCSEGSLQDIAKRIEEKGINRVVIASCTPRTHEPLFRDTLEKAGLNPYLLEMANIRDQCSWVHKGEPVRATEKAIDLVKSAVAKALLLEPLEPQISEIIREAAVVGGGCAGLCAARDLSRQGFGVHLIELGESLGGTLRNIRVGLYGQDAPELLDPLVESLQNVDITTDARIESICGSVGDFTITLEGGKELRVGAIIISPGAEIASGCEYGEGAITSLELDRILKEGEPLPKRVTLVQCVGVRNERYGCSRFCCAKALDQAKHMASMGVEVSIIHRDMMTFQRGSEELYREVSALGVRFYRTDRPPRIRENGLEFRSIYDEDLIIPSDLVVLSVGLVPSDSNKDLSLQLKVPLSQEGFFMEKHPKLAPVEFAVDGIFVAGCAQYPKDLLDSMIQGSAAAAKASALLSRKSLMTPGQVCAVDEERCRGCGECESLCNFGAARLIEVSGRPVSKIEAKMCKGCGICAVSCPTNAIEARGFTTKQIDAQLSALIGGGK